VTIGPCQDQTPSIGCVEFVPANFITYYPEFAAVSTGALTNNFNRASLILNRCCGSKVRDANVRQILLGLLTAHVTALTNGVNGAPPQGVVGRVSSATEGSVSVDTDLGLAPTASATKAYLQQTQYGLEFLASTAQYRSAVYAAGPQFCASPRAPFGPPSVGCGYGAPWWPR
jgi:hypothetical protein